MKIQNKTFCELFSMYLCFTSQTLCTENEISHASHLVQLYNMIPLLPRKLRHHTRNRSPELLLAISYNTGSQSCNRMRTFPLNLNLSVRV